MTHAGARHPQRKTWRSTDRVEPDSEAKRQQASAPFGHHDAALTGEILKGPSCISSVAGEMIPKIHFDTLTIRSRIVAHCRVRSSARPYPRIRR